MLNLFNKFPRQVAFDGGRKLVNNMQEFLAEVNAANGYKRVFTSLYNNPWEPDKLEVDKIWFDFDGDTKLQDIFKLHGWLEQEDYKHIMFMSGGGFHLYLMCCGYEKLRNKRATLANAHRYFIEKLGIVIDKNVIGDISRVATIPNTYNVKRRRFCIPISGADIGFALVNNSMEDIYKTALKQQKEFYWYGSKLFDISQFDGEEKNIYTPIQLTTGQVKAMENVSCELLPCLKHAITQLHVGWRERFLIAVYMRDNGFLVSEVEAFFKKHLSEEDYKHCIMEEHQVRKVFLNARVRFPSCDTLQKEGRCISDCKGQKLYW